MRLLTLPLAVLFTTGCVSFTTAQTGRTLKKGDTAGYLGLAVHDEDSEDKEDDGTTTTEQSTTGFVGGARHGVAQGFDIGARGSTLGLVMIDGKHQLVATKSFALSVGLGLGFVNYEYESKSKSESGTSTATSDSKGHTRITDVPVYMSYDVAPNASLYWAPRYVYAHTSSENDDEDGDNGGGSGRIVGVTFGFKAGGDLGFFGEAAYFKSPDDDVDSSGTQLAMGLTFGP